MKAMVPWMWFQGTAQNLLQISMSLECPTTSEQVRTSPEGLVEVPIRLLIPELGGSWEDWAWSIIGSSQLNPERLTKMNKHCTNMSMNTRCACRSLSSFPHSMPPNPGSIFWLAPAEQTCDAQEPS